MATASFPDRWKYDLFVSFRGEDVRKTFMDHLFKDLKQKGIHAFRDDGGLPKGEEISPGLYKAIEESRFLIVIFSKNYASSSFCLRELVKILKCKQTGEPKHEVRIIFYDVKPDVVRKQTESYARAFAKHESSKKTEVAEWKKALTMAADISGWDLEYLTNGYEAKFIESISTEIFKKLCFGPLYVGEKLVGIDTHVKKLNLLRFVGSDRVHMIGICGMSGIGKTTLAKAIYNLLHVHFEGSCFCEDVKQQDLTQVQKQLIEKIMKIEDVKIHTSSEGIMIIKQRLPSKPILLVLDNVDNHEQLEALAGSASWFSKGSFIVFTSQDRQLLKSHEVNGIYDMPVLPNHEAFELFCLHAFGQQHPTGDFKELAYQVVERLQGHPLALKVLGRFLYKKPVNVWKSQLDSLQKYPNSEIQEKLRPSFDGLDLGQKRIFLDIACCFIGENKDFAVLVLNDCDCFADVNIEVLVDKSLITISPYDMSLQMHELIRSMARKIVYEECNMPGNRSRLWGPSMEVYDVLSKNKATKAVEVIDLFKEKTNQKFNINSKAFAPMENLRILKLPNDHNVNFFGRLGYLSYNLKYLSWHGCPFKFLPSDFYPEKIVAIDLSYSHIKSLWTTPKRFTRLKIMKLNHCRNLISTPDFTEMPNIKELNLEGCVNLIKIHPSIGMLESLVVLNLSGCFKVDTLPEALGRIKSLVELRVHRTAIIKLPSFVFLLTNLLILSFGQLESFWFRGLNTIAQPSWLPQSLVLSSLAGLRSLRKLDLSFCNILQVPENIGGLSCLEELYLEGNNFTSLPRSLSQLSCLQSLSLEGCKKLEVLPELPPSIEVLRASYCNVLQVSENIGGLSCLVELNLEGNNFTSLPRSLSQLPRLYDLVLDGCKKLEVLPELPLSIERLYVSDCPKLVRNVRFESGEPEPLETCVICHCSRDKLPSLLRYIDIHTNICEFFHEQYFLRSMEMFFPGNRIPEWFRNQSMGSEVTVALPPDWCYNKVKGYAFCIVFTPKKFDGGIAVYVNNFDGALLCDTWSVHIGRSEDESIEIHDSDRIWLCYQPIICGWEEAKYYVTFSFRGYYEEEEDVEVKNEEENVDVKKCGVRLVCDEEDLKEVMDASIINHYLPTKTHDGHFFYRSWLHKNITITW